MERLGFSYRDSRGQEAEWLIANWRESGRYIQGICEKDGGFRTFRKDRVLAYRDACDVFLVDAYPEPPPKPVAKPQILFTGFAKVQRASLESKAAAQGMKICKSVTKGLVFLCCGPNAGPTKIQQSRESDVYILNESQLLWMLETGELLDDDERTSD